MDSSTPIGFIGGGNMARSLVGGLAARGHAGAALHVYDLDPECSRALAADFGVTACASPERVAAGCEAIILAVKPQHMRPALAPLGPALPDPAPLLISIAAGIRTASLNRWLGRDCPLVRCMPNTPALVHCGATAMYAADGCSEAHRELAGAILGAVGISAWVENESALDAVTAVSGSGPAYFFLFQELLLAAARDAGLEESLAAALVRQTALGAARMVAESGEDPATLRARVTSPGGTTEQALRVFGEGGLGDLVGKAVEAARKRSEELADELDA